MFYSVFHNSRSCKCVDANLHFSQNNDVTLTRHGKSRLAPFRAENIFRKSNGGNFGCWSRCLSNVQKCALGVILPPPPLPAVEGLNTESLFDNESCFIFPETQVFLRYGLKGDFWLNSLSMTNILYIKSPTPMTGYLDFSVPPPYVSLGCNVQVHATYDYYVIFH